MGSLRHSHSRHSQDTDVSTTSEDFKVFGQPDYQRILPTCVDELECRYPAGFSFSRLRFGEVKAPKASREYGTGSPCTSPAQPDVPQRVMELSGFTRTAPRSDLTLPEQPMSSVPTVSSVPPPLSTPGDTFPLPQPAISDGRMDSLPAICSTVSKGMGWQGQGTSCPSAPSVPSGL